jgi:hypothetical protein
MVKNGRMWYIEPNFINIPFIIKRIVFLDFIHCLVSQEQTKLKIIDKR